jgi:hypothetical protein
MLLTSVKIKVVKKSKTCSVIKPTFPKGTEGWLNSQAVKSRNGTVLFKRVSADLKTQENTPSETVWTIGETLTHPNWKPKEQECGPGKYHACSRPYFCDEFRSESTDRYIAIQIAKKDLYAWPEPQYPHKIAFRRGRVLYECDRYGTKLEAKK